MVPLALTILLFFKISRCFDSCPISENNECSRILSERFSLSIEQYNGLPPLQQIILQDTVDCISEGLCPVNLDKIIGEEVKCTNGFATDLNYPCHNIDLLSFLPLRDLGSHVNASGSDIWGYTEYNDNNEYIGYYALSGQTDGTSIVDITDPINPNVLAFIQSNIYPLRQVVWRDIKTYNQYAFVVADAKPQNDHHLQIFNIQNIINDAQQYQLENGYGSILNVSNDNENVIIYEGIGYSHNIFVNEDTGYIYSVGIADCGGKIGGIHIVDISNINNSLTEYAGCYNGVRYVHDMQCVVYNGPHLQFYDHEICFLFAPAVLTSIDNVWYSDANDTLTIIDVTDKQNIIELSKTFYNLSAYNHQGWVTNSHEYLLMDDELDEQIYTEQVPTQVTFIWDIRNLSLPILVNKYDSNLTVVDHNQYIIDNKKSVTDNAFKGFVFQSNYEAGLRVLNIDDILNGNLYEIAYFDTYIWYDANSTSHDSVNPRGAWSVYPYFKPNKNKDEFSDVVVVQDINTGLYVLRVNINLNDIFDDSKSSNVLDDEVIIIIAVIVGIIIIGFIGYCMYRSKNKRAATQEETAALISMDAK